MGSYIALLRGINVGGHNKLPMAGLRETCAELGWTEVRTYIQSGNVVFAATGKAAALEEALEKAIAARFGFAPAVIVRSSARLNSLAAANPFPKESAREPHWVLVGFAKQHMKDGAAETIAVKGQAGERVEEAGGALWFHYPAGVGTSKLTPSLIDRAAGSPVTARNWRTMTKLIDMLE
jgi:uncharacterized protein (DUF1697 family)